MKEDWDQYKDNSIDFLLNAFMDAVCKIPLPNKVVVRFAISGCLRFACAAAPMLGLTIQDLLQELEVEWHSESWNFGTMISDKLN